MLYQLLALASVAVASPIAVALPKSTIELGTRQLLDRTSLTENEFSNSLICREIVFVWARGSTESGNMVRFSIPNHYIGQTKRSRAL